MNYFIKDCNDNIRGNPEGYATMQRARKALEQKHKFTGRLSLRQWLFNYYDQHKNTILPGSLIYSIE